MEEPKDKRQEPNKIEIKNLKGFNDWALFLICHLDLIWILSFGSCELKIHFISTRSIATGNWHVEQPEKDT